MLMLIFSSNFHYCLFETMFHRYSNITCGVLNSGTYICHSIYLFIDTTVIFLLNMIVSVQLVKVRLKLFHFLGFLTRRRLNQDIKNEEDRDIESPDFRNIEDPENGSDTVYFKSGSFFFIKYFIYSKLKLEKKKMYSDNNKYTTTNSQKTEQSDNRTKTKPSQQK